MNAFRHIVVATDFGPASQRAIATAADMAGCLGAKITLVHALELSDPLPPFEDLRAASELSLGVAVTALRKRGITCSSAVGAAGETWRGILELAEQAGGDLLVVGSHGRRGLAHALLGSVAEKVVRRARIPVLTVHGFWFEDRAQAGKELAEELERVRMQAPVVLAISRGGIVVGAEVAKALGTSVELLLTRPLADHDRAFGAICEGDTVLLDPENTGLARLPEERENVLVRARAALKEDVLDLRGADWIPDLWRRTALLLTDALMEPWGALAATSVVRKQGADHIIVTAPIASDRALAILEKEAVDVVVPHTMPAGFEATAAYRHFQEPSRRALFDILHRDSTAA